MRTIFLIAALVASLAGAVAATPVSTNPDTPLDLKGNVILGMFAKEGSQPKHYFRFKAGPGTFTLRLTMRPNSDGMTAKASIADEEGNELGSVSDGTSNDKDVVKTLKITLAAEKTLILSVGGNASFYGNRHPTWRAQLDGDVSLDKKAKPLQL